MSQIGPVDLVSMVPQSREMKKLVETHKKWVELYRRLKQMQDEEINKILQPQHTRMRITCVYVG